MTLNLRTLDLNLLPILDALMREQNLSRAAAQLGMSQPAVSNALKRLRQTFNDDLFVRTARGLKPTPRAQELHSSIQPALILVEQGCGSRDFDPATSTETINISMNAATEYLATPQIMQWLRHKAPHMKFKAHPDHLEDIPSKLKDGVLDYALDYVPYPAEQFNSVVLEHVHLNVVCSQDHSILHGRITLKQFETLPHVTLIPRINPAHKSSTMPGTPIEHLMGAKLPHRNTIMHVSSFVAIPEIVASTDLIATIPTRLAEHPHYKDKIQHLEMPFEYPKAEIRMHWHKSRDNSPARKWFVERMQRMIKEKF